MFITANGNRFEVELEDNVATRALLGRLADGAFGYDADDYGDFEKVGDLGFSLPTCDRQVYTEPGDVVLFQGDHICIYYGNNSWAFTRLGRITDTTDLRERLGEGPVTVTLSLD